MENINEKKEGKKREKEREKTKEKERKGVSAFFGNIVEEFIERILGQFLSKDIAFI